MMKFVITYFFAITLLSSVITPSFYSLMENNVEIELSDVGEEEENKGQEGISELDAKIYYSYSNILTNIYLEKQENLQHYTNHYSAHFCNHISPPPEKLT